MYRIFLLFCFACLLNCQPKELETVFEHEEAYTIVKMSHLTTKDEMTSIKEKLKPSGLDFDYEGSEFFDDGKLRNLQLKLTLPEGSGGMTSADLVTLQFKYWGFIFQKDKKPNLRIGEMTEIQ